MRAGRWCGRDDAYSYAPVNGGMGWHVAANPPHTITCRFYLKILKWACAAPPISCLAVLCYFNMISRSAISFRSGSLAVFCYFNRGWIMVTCTPLVLQFFIISLRTVCVRLTQQTLQFFVISLLGSDQLRSITEPLAVLCYFVVSRLLRGRSWLTLAVLCYFVKSSTRWFLLSLLAVLCYFVLCW